MAGLSSWAFVSAELFSGLKTIQSATEELTGKSAVIELMGVAIISQFFMINCFLFISCSMTASGMLYGSCF